MRVNYINGETILTPTEPSELTKGNIYHLDTFSMPPSHIIVKPKIYCDDMETYFKQCVKDEIYPISLIPIEDLYAKKLIENQKDILIKKAENCFMVQIGKEMILAQYLSQVQDFYREVAKKEFTL